MPNSLTTQQLPMSKVFTIQDIRKSYIEFFEYKNHLKLESASLMPAQDPSLLFTTAGMVPFKNYFSGAEVPPRDRVVSVQKCFRTTDLEEVGKTLRHLSFFEMLGNFSFGDYFKKEAIEFAWEYSTQVLPFAPEQIWITVFREDNEAYDIWRNHIGIPANRIVHLDEADNFWGPAGATGACGPCSELYIDRGEGYSFDPANAKPGGEGDRFLEFWNLVFNQFNKNIAGEFEPLSQTGIDTGAGLERLGTLLQGVDSVYDTNELMQLRDQVAKVFKAKYQDEQMVPIRVITDHVRALTFAMADGIFPSNESRGYVLRRMLRRALLFGRKLGQTEPLLHQLVDTVNNIYSPFYHNLLESSALTQKYIQAEEQRFLQTLDAGSHRLEELLHLAAEKNQNISGKDAFVLYDTFGFPLEITVELAEQKGVQVDTQQFAQLMEEQRERGRQAWKGSEQSLPQLPANTTAFRGYEVLQTQAKLQYIVHNYQLVENISEEKIDKEDVLFLVFDNSPFYAESGGQVGDSGFLSSNNAKLEVIDTKKNGEQWIHIAKNLEGNIAVGEVFDLQVDALRREKLRANHSATHLLNASLRKNLGDHVKQSGSLVHENYLRFDFTHPAAVSKDEIFQIETEVNQAIDASLAVKTQEMTKDEAQKTGALMTFGEKYGERVRVVRIGELEQPQSVEFCGGTHVDNTNTIDFFLIQKESSPGAGNRRLEALTGAIARSKLNEIQKELETSFKNFSQLDKSSFSQEIKQQWQAIEKMHHKLSQQQEKTAIGLSHQWNYVRELSQALSLWERELKKQEKKALQKKAHQFDQSFQEQVLQQMQRVGNFDYLFVQLEDISIASLKKLSDLLREKNSQLVVLLSSIEGDKWNVVLATSNTICQATAFDAGTLIKNSIKELNGNAGGGGKKEIAQAGGKDMEFLSVLTKHLNKKIQQILSKHSA